MGQGLEVVLEEEMFMSKFGLALAGILRGGWCLIVLLPCVLCGGDVSHAQNRGQVRGGQGEQPR